MITSKLYLMMCDESAFTVESTKDFFELGPQPILWRHKGVYGLIPAAIVANVIEFFTGDLGLPNIHPMCMHRFHWGSTITVPSEIGELLFNEQFDNQTESNKN